jgi:hypothetical protein
MKTFTLEEAQLLVPVLESLLNRAVEARAAAQEIEEGLQELRQRIFISGGIHVDVVAVMRRRTELEALIQRVRDVVIEIDSIGVQVKDLDTGLLDFPCRLGDDIVLLCWKMGEPRISHWHTVESGFQGRQPLDHRFQRTKPEKPN